MNGANDPQQKIYYNLIQKTGLWNRYQFYLFFILYGVCILHFAFLTMMPYIFQQRSYECKEYDSDACTDYVCSLPFQERFSYIPQPSYHSLADQLNMDFRCESSYVTGFVYLLLPIATIFGNLFFSALSSKFGRKNTLLFTSIIMLTGVCIIVLGGLRRSILTICFGIMINCTGSSISFQCACCIGSEVVSEDRRIHYLNLLCTANGVGQILDVTLFKYIHEWKTIFIFIYIIPLTLFIILIIFFVEKTPFDLLNSESEDQILRVLKKISQVNHVPFRMTLFQVQKIKNQYSKIVSLHSKKFNIMDLFKYKSLKKMIFPLMVLNFVIGYIYLSEPLLMDNSSTTITDPYSLQQFHGSLIDGITIIWADFLVFFTFKYLLKNYIKVWLGIIIIYIQIYFMCMASQSAYVCQLIFYLFYATLIAGAIAFINLINFSVFPIQIRFIGITFLTLFQNFSDLLQPMASNLYDQSKQKYIFTLIFATVIGVITLSLMKQIDIKPSNEIIEELIAKKKENQMKI